MLVKMLVKVTEKMTRRMTIKMQAFHFQVYIIIDLCNP